MASIKAQIDILLTGQRNVNNLLGQLNQIESAITEIESKWKVASAALQRTEIRLGATGTRRPRDERGRFTQDPDRQARLNALADRRAAVERLSRARAELIAETRYGALRRNSINGQIEGNERILRQTERRIALESKLNTAIDRLERRQSAYARGGGGSRLSEELQDRVRNIQTAFQAVGGTNAKNLSLVRSLATELGSIVELQNEVNRGIRLKSTGFYKSQGLERSIASLRGQGVPASAFATVGGQMRQYRSAVQRGNQPEAETIAKRIKENLDRIGRDLDKSFAELRKSQSVKLAAQSWQKFFEDAASQALQIKQNARNTKESWQAFFKDAANQALAIKQAGQNTKKGWKNFFEDAANQALSIKQNGQETKQAWKSFFKDAANQALAIKQAGKDTKQSWKNFFEDATNQALSIKQNGQETKQAWKSFFEDAANQALAIKQAGQDTKQSWKNFFEDATSQALAIKQNGQETKNAWKNFFEDAANQALAIRQNGAETKQAWRSFFEDAANQALAIKQDAQQTRSAWKNFFEDAANQALSIKQSGQETKQAWKSFFEDAASQALAIKQNAQETKNTWKNFFEDASSSALQIKQNNAEAKASWRSFFEEASNQALSIKENAQKTKNAWKSFFEDAANQALNIKQSAQQAKEAWKNFFADAADQALAIKQGAAEAKNAWKLFFEDAASQALQIKENAKETKNSWQVFFEDAAGEASRLRSPMLQAKQNWQQFFIDAAKEAATARRKPIGAMTPEQRVAGGILDPASLRQTRLGRVARGRERQEAVGRAGSEGLIGGAFPLLFGQGAGAAAGGLAGGVAGGLAGGGLGFGLSLLGTVIGTAVDEADALDKQLTKINASAKGVGNTSADVRNLASSLGIAKEEAVTLLAQFKQFGSAQIRKDLALVFGGGREAILERLESIVKEEDVLQAIAAARKEITNQEAISLLNTFKMQGGAQAQLVLREALLRISEKETIEDKKRITLLDRINAAAVAAGAAAGDVDFSIDPAAFGKERAKDQQKIFDKEREQRRKNYDTAIKESQEFFKELDALSGSGKSSKEALGADLLSAIDSRNEAIDNARKQREQQIADIRKQAIEAAARIEEDLADKRKQIERDIQDVRRSRADSAIDADLRFRELRGEDPGVIEAERELLAISREDRDARIELQRRLGDEEEAQAKVIAEFEKGVAKQIQDANLAGARAIGEIQSNYAKQVAKIIDEGSGKGAKRIEAAAKLYALYLERGTMQQGRIMAGAQAMPEPVMRNNQLDYQEVPKGVVTPRFRELDQKIYDLQKQLQSRSKGGIGDQFTALLGAEGGGAFDVSKVAADFGQIASASFISGLLAQNPTIPESQKLRDSRGRELNRRQPTAYPLPVIPSTTATPPGISGAAAATTQARKDLGAETLAALDEKKFANLKNYFAEVNAEGLAVNKNLIEQNRLLDAQLVLMGSGVESGLARQLAEIEDVYAARLKQLEGKRDDAVKKGWDVGVVERFYNTELELLEKTTDEIKNRTTEYAKQSEFLLAIASLEQQIAVTGAAEQAGFFGAGASAYTGELLRSGDPGQATELAQQTRALEVKQAVAGIRGELNSLTDSTNIAITAANGIGDAFGQAFQGLISGSMSAQEALSSFFKSVADSFLSMAAEIIAKQMTMIVLQTILKALGAVAGASGGGGGGGASSGPGIDPGAFNIGPAGQIPGLVQAANGATFSNGLAQFANGGAFTNSIVSSPTLFQFADGGVTRMGEMGEAGPEAIMPLKRGPDGRLGVDASGMAVPYQRSAAAATTPEMEVPYRGNGPALAVPYLRSAGSAGGDSMNGTIDVKFETVRIGGVDYVTRDEAEQIGRESAIRGADLASKRYRQNPSARRRDGIG